MRRDELLALAVRLGGRHRLTPPRQAGRGRAGTYLGDLAGQSVDFHDYRAYQPGDDLRRVDWRAYARHGQMHLKLFREEVSPLVELILDDSASMGAYPGKAEAALFLAALLGEAARNAGGRPVLCRSGRRFAGPDFAAALLNGEFAGTDPVPTVRFPGRPRALRFFLSDCLFADGIDLRFAHLAAGGLAFQPVMILCRSERHPEARGGCRLVDAESPGTFLDLVVDAAALADYRRRLERHEEALELAARRWGGSLLTVDVPDGGLELRDAEALAARLAAEGVVTAT